MLITRRSVSRPRLVRFSVVGLALAIWFQGCQCDTVETSSFPTVSVPIINVGTGSGTVGIPETDKETSCVLGASGGAAAQCTIKFVDAGAGGTFSLSPTPGANSVFLGWVGGPCSGAPTTCGLSFSAGGPFDLAQVTVNFSIAPPTLTAIAPISAISGSAPVVVPVTLTGINLLGATAVAVTGGITASPPVVGSATEVTSTLTIPPGTSGTKTVTVTTPSGTSSGISFAVSVPPPPALTSITPATGVIGASFPVTIVGTNFDGSVASPVSAGNVVLSNLTLVSSTQLTATMSIPNTLAPGNNYKVSVATQFGTSNSLSFQVTAPTPVLNSLVPKTGTQGTTVPVVLNGSGFSLTSNTVTVAGTGIAVSTAPLTSVARIDATFVIAATAPIGNHDVTVTTAGGASASLPFQVIAAPVPLRLTSISPTGAAFGQTVPVTLVGTGFRAGIGISAGTGIMISNIVVVDSTHITATFLILESATFGDHNVTVTVGGQTSNAVIFNIV